MTRGLQGVITAIERSNNITFQWDKEGNEKTLIDKKFGGLFGRRQYEKNDGKPVMVTELRNIRSVAGLTEAEVPEDILLSDEPVGRPPQTQVAPQSSVGDGFMNIPDGEDEGIPFL